MRRHRGPRTHLALALIGGGLLVLLLAVPIAAHRRPRAPTSSGPIVITVHSGAGLRLPRSFFGLSTEYWAPPEYLVRPRIFERVLSLLRVRADGPLLLRIGGDSADRTYWNPGSFPLVSSSTVLTNEWFSVVSTLVEHLGLRVTFDLNVRHSTPSLSAGLAQAALQFMPPGSLAGFEIGNEPNRYRHGYTANDYVQDFRSYVSAISGIGPTLPRLGPATGDSVRAHSYTWISDAISGDRGLLDVVTAHRYPLSACAPPGSQRAPTIAKLLSDALDKRMVAPIKAMVRLSHGAGLRFRLDELNSISCGGRRGVSNTFATALWAPDALFSLLQAGVDGVNVHIRPDTINGPFVITHSGLSVRPLLYGLILFARTLSPGGRLAAARVAGPSVSGLAVWAVRLPHHRLHVLVINRGRAAKTLALKLLARGDARIVRLLAPSVRSTRGVTLAGAHLGSEGGWSGPEVVQQVRPVNGEYELSVPGFSAALITVRLR